MRTIDADALKRRAQRVATEAWKMKLTAKIETTLNQFIDWINDAPTIEPERKTGKWIERNPQNSDKCRLIECDQCGFSHIVGFNVPYEHWIENRNFCERCGADMRGEHED